MAPRLKQKPSGYWFVEFEGLDGSRRRVSTGSRDKEVARSLMRDIVLGTDPRTSTDPKARKETGQVTMNDLFDRAMKTVWAPGEAKSQGTIRSNVKKLSGLIGSEPIEAMTYSRLEKLVEELRGEGYAPATIKRKMDMVSKALRMATKWTDDKGRPLLAAKPVMPTIRVANLKDRILERSEELAVFNAIEKRRLDEPGRQWFRMKALVRFLLDTGARLSEALATKPSDISDRGSYKLVTFARYRTKNDKPRSVPLTDAVAEELDDLQDHLGKLADGSGYGYFPMNPGTVWYMWDNIREDLKKAGFDVSDVSLHTLRHTCLTRLAQGGMDLLRLQKWAGHSDPKITAERYTHLQPADLVAGLDILNSNPATPQIQARNGSKPVIVPSPKASVKRAANGTASLN